MTKFIISAFLFLIPFVSFTQCSTVSVQISSSDTSYVQLYQAGFFNIPSGFANICEWKVTDFSGQVIHQEITSGGSSEQSTVLFEHLIPITDSMKASIKITNETEGITCTMADTLYWKETEVLPGAFIGNWDVLSNNPGIEEDIMSSTELIKLTPKSIRIIPSIVYDEFKIEGKIGNEYSIFILDVNGKILMTLKKSHSFGSLNVSLFSAGVYFVHIVDEKNKRRVIKKIVKM